MRQEGVIWRDREMCIGSVHASMNDTSWSLLRTERWLYYTCSAPSSKVHKVACVVDLFYHKAIETCL